MPVPNRLALEALNSWWPTCASPAGFQNRAVASSASGENAPASAMARGPMGTWIAVADLAIDAHVVPHNINMVARARVIGRATRSRRLDWPAFHWERT